MRVDAVIIASVTGYLPAGSFEFESGVSLAYGVCRLARASSHLSSGSLRMERAAATQFETIAATAQGCDIIVGATVLQIAAP
jgi:hypothetical protein